jgi:hypothetical protein
MHLSPPRKRTGPWFNPIRRAVAALALCLVMVALAAGGDGTVPDSTASFYNNWIGTIPWVWVLAGLAGPAIHSLSRQDVVPRWIGRVGLVMGGLALLLGISPLEYMAGPVATLWLVVTSVGFLVGDRAHRSAGA